MPHPARPLRVLPSAGAPDVGLAAEFLVPLVLAGLIDNDDALDSEWFDRVTTAELLEWQRYLGGHADIDRRMRSGELSLAIEIPPGFARDASRGRNVQMENMALFFGASPPSATTQAPVSVAMSITAAGSKRST